MINLDSLENQSTHKRVKIAESTRRGRGVKNILKKSMVFIFFDCEIGANVNVCQIGNEFTTDHPPRHVLAHGQPSGYHDKWRRNGFD